ncbi:L-glutamine-phosphate cytidylyltransferase [Candidatus Magnetomoraceae bacterium gMMP-15]
MKAKLQAVILAAGKGNRLAGIIGDKPKCMALIGKKTIIERQIKALQSIGVKNIYVVVGYKKDMLADFIKHRFNNIKFIENPIYDRTNTIYSLYLAIPFLTKDFFYLNGDVLFKKSLLEKLLAEKKTGMAVEYKECGDEEVKVKLNGRRIISISKTVSLTESSGEFIGVALFRENVNKLFLKSLKHEVEENCITRDYFERAIDKIIERIELLSVDITGEPVIEIDFPDDFKQANILARQMDI